MKKISHYLKRYWFAYLIAFMSSAPDTSSVNITSGDILRTTKGIAIDFLQPLITKDDSPTLKEATPS